MEVKEFVRAENPQYKSLEMLFNDAATRSTDAHDEFDALVISDNFAGKYDFYNRFVELVENEWKTRNSKLIPGQRAYQESGLMDDYHGERCCSDFVFEEDIEAIMSSLDAILPNPEDKHFVRVVRGKVDGVLKAMHLLVKIHSNRQDTDMVVREANLLGKPELYEGGHPRLPRELPYQQRMDIMLQRVRRVGQLADGLLPLEKYNRNLWTLLLNRKITPQVRDRLIIISNIYALKIGEMTDGIVVMAPEVIAAQWWKVLLDKVNRLVDSYKGKDQQLCEILDLFIDNLNHAPTRDQFTAVINKLA